MTKFYNLDHLLSGGWYHYLSSSAHGWLDWHAGRTEQIGKAVEFGQKEFLNKVNYELSKAREELERGANSKGNLRLVVI